VLAEQVSAQSQPGGSDVFRTASTQTGNSTGARGCHRAAQLNATARDGRSVPRKGHDPGRQPRRAQALRQRHPAADDLHHGQRRRCPGGRSGDHRTAAARHGGRQVQRHHAGSPAALSAGARRAEGPPHHPPALAAQRQPAMMSDQQFRTWPAHHPQII